MKEKKRQLKHYSVRLYPDQIIFLRKQPNAAAWIRQAIDRSRALIEIDESQDKVIFLSKQIKILDSEISQLDQDETFREAREVISRIKQCEEELEGIKKSKIHLIDNTMNSFPLTFGTTHDERGRYYIIADKDGKKSIPLDAGDPIIRAGNEILRRKISPTNKLSEGDLVKIIREIQKRKKYCTQQLEKLEPLAPLKYKIFDAFISKRTRLREKINKFKAEIMNVSKEEK